MSLSALHAGDRVAVAEASGAPKPLLADLPAALSRLPGCELLLGWVLDPELRVGDLEVPVRAFMGGPVLSRAIGSGAVRYLPYRYSQLPRALSGPLRPDVVLLQVRPHPEGWALAGTASWSTVAARHARLVLAEVNEAAAPLDAPVLPRDTVTVVASGGHDLLDLPAREPSDDEWKVAEQVLTRLPLPCVLQYGPGGVASAVLARLRGEPVTLRSGLLDAAALPLLTTSHVGRPQAATVVGPAGFYGQAAAAGVRLVGVEESHDIGRLAGTPGFVALNTALQVDLSGAVNVERVGGALVGGVGGHADFALAASLSEGGLSVVAFPSRRRGNPSVVSLLGVPASTPRVDVDLFVTEHGVADIRGLDEPERAEALIRIAHPEDREALEKAIRSEVGAGTGRLG